jgi:hypothetical protein
MLGVRLTYIDRPYGIFHVQWSLPDCHIVHHPLLPPVDHARPGIFLTIPNPLHRVSRRETYDDYLLLSSSAFAVQVVGIMFTLSDSPSAINTGLKIYSIGNGIQLSFIVIFLCLVWRFFMNLKKIGDEELSGKGRRLCLAIAISVGLIVVSSSSPY